MRKHLADRLIDLCFRNADRIAENWYKSLVSNPRTRCYTCMDKAACLRLATSMYRNLGNMYFAEDAYHAVEQHLAATNFVDIQIGKGIPIEAIVYALILLRREIWFHSEEQSLFNIPDDMYELVVSINRILLLFDYVTYIVVSTYESRRKNPD